MASVTIASVADRYPVGTVVAAYKASDFSPGSTSPSGSSVASGTVQSDGSLTFSGLTVGLAYKAYAVVSGVPVSVSFSARDSSGDNAPTSGIQLVESSTALQTSFGYTAGLLTSYVEQRAIDGKSRTVTITRNTDGTIATQAAGAWA